MKTNHVLQAVIDAFESAKKNEITSSEIIDPPGLFEKKEAGKTVKLINLLNDTTFSVVDDCDYIIQFTRRDYTE